MPTSTAGQFDCNSSGFKDLVKSIGSEISLTAEAQATVQSLAFIFVNAILKDLPYVETKLIYQSISKATVGEEVAKYALSEGVKVVTKFNCSNLGEGKDVFKSSGLYLKYDAFVNFINNPLCGQEEIVFLGAITEYIIAEIIELSNVQRMKVGYATIRLEDIKIALKGDEDLKPLYLEFEKPLVDKESLTKDGSACVRWKTTENFNSDDDSDGIPTYLRWQTIGNECKSLNSFPLERWNCGHWESTVDHSNHNVERVREITKISKVLEIQCQNAGYYESSDCDSEFTAFTALVNETDTEVLDPLVLSSIAMWLGQRLKLNTDYTSAKTIPIQGKHFHMHEFSDREERSGDREISKIFNDSLTSCFCFRGAADSGSELINTYPVIFAGFTKFGDVAGVYAIRCDT